MRQPIGKYLVTGQTAYRGHEPGVTFIARLDVNSARRALERGDIQLLELVVDKLEPGSYRLPQGWLTNETGG